MHDRLFSGFMLTHRRHDPVVKGGVVFALSNEQLGVLKLSGGFPAVPQEGPALYDEARAAVEGYYP